MSFQKENDIILTAFNNCGEVSEWSKVIDSKSIVPQGTVGSNPTLSASEITGFAGFPQSLFYTQKQPDLPLLVPFWFHLKN